MPKDIRDCTDWMDPQDRRALLGVLHKARDPESREECARLVAMLLRPAGKWPLRIEWVSTEKTPAP